MSGFKALIERIRETYSQIETLDLSYHALGKEDFTALYGFIENTPSLRRLNLTNNFFTTSQIVSLHNLAQDLNESRSPEDHLFLYSDYSLWCTQYRQPQYGMIYWALSPEQWVKDEQPGLLFTSICQHPEVFHHILPAFTREAQYTNLVGWTPLIAAIQCAALPLLSFLRDQLTIDYISEEVIKAYNHISFTNLNHEDVLYQLIVMIYLRKGSVIEAKNLLQELPLIPEKNRAELLGAIALSESNYNEAYIHYTQAANLGSGKSHYELGRMIRDGRIDQDYHTIEEVKFHFKKASDLGLIYGEIEYALIVEAQGADREAYYHYLRLYDLFQVYPHLKMDLKSLKDDKVMLRFELASEINLLIGNVIQKRVELTLNRQAQLIPQPSRVKLNTQKFFETLVERLSIPSFDAVITQFKHALFYQLKDTPLTFTFIREILFEKMDNCPPNTGLLSLDTKVFTEALCKEIQNYLEDSALNLTQRQKVTS